jgi:ferredoxin-NADP reductase
VRIPETQQAPRHYCMNNVPLQGNTLDIAVRREEGGVYSNYIHSVLKEGDKVLLGAPMGLFCNPDGFTGNIAFVAGGIGASPIMSFLRQCVRTHRRIPACLLVPPQSAESRDPRRCVLLLLLLRSRCFVGGDADTAPRSRPAWS